MLNPKTKNRSSKKIEPSTRDSISTWLDVLTGMLVMPETQRLQVRDELEDHLRSRVDDLLIMGKPEPEAIRIAVAELGETAELAKLITHAHTKSNPRRKIMNTALITVALAGMSFGGFTYINGTGAPSATPSNGGAVPVVVPEETQKTIEVTHAFDIKEATVLELLGEVSSAFDLKLDLGTTPAATLARKSRGRGVQDFVGEYTLMQAIRKIQYANPEFMDAFRVLFNTNVLSIVSSSDYERSQIQTTAYAIPGWLTMQEQAVYAKSLTEILDVKYNLHYASIQKVGGTIVVAASPIIHQEIVEYKAMLMKVYAQQQEQVMIQNQKDVKDAGIRDHQRRERMSQLAIEQKNERDEAIKRVQSEFDRVRTELIQKKTMIKELKSRLHELASAFDPKTSTRRAKTEASEIEKAMVDTQLLQEEYQSRYNYLRDTLIESEYSELFEGLE